MGTEQIAEWCAQCGVEGHTDESPHMVKARDLEPGMVLDLEGDPYVRCDYPDCTMPDVYEFEYGVVDFVELEDVAPNYPAVAYLTNGDAYGFPRDHELRVVRR